MINKQEVVNTVRQILPEPAVRGLEEIYRKGRVHLLSARYGDPARGQKVIAVTGTNGKTTTLNFINEILKEAGQKTAMFSTALIEIAGNTKVNDLNATVPSTQQLMEFLREAKKAKVDYVLMEVSSHALHQHKLDTIPVMAAVMTNLTQDHLDYHGSMEAYAAAKGRLFAQAPKFIVLNRDDQWFDYFDQFPASGQKITYGSHKEAEARIEHVKLYKRGSEARVVIDGRTTLELATALVLRRRLGNGGAGGSRLARHAAPERAALEDLVVRGAEGPLAERTLVVTGGGTSGAPAGHQDAALRALDVRFHLPSGDIGS